MDKIKKLYQVKDSHLKNPKIWVKKTIDYLMNQLNGVNYSDPFVEEPVFYKFKCSIGNGIFIENSFRLKEMKLISSSQDEIDDINNKFSVPLERMNEEKFIKCALYILNLYPSLSSTTCMGWDDYDDKTKNPNWMGGEYIFPDNNIYTVCLHKGTVRIYPGKGDAFCIWINSEPLVEFKINLNEWAEKNENENIEIHAIK